MFKLTALFISALALSTSVAAFDNKIYLIRHGEKPSDDDTPGLSSQGEDRAQCLRNVFGANSGYNIGKIITQDYKSDGSRDRPYETVLPLSQDLGLTIDHVCDRDDPDCAKSEVKDYADNNDGNILICWEHKALDDVASALGVSIDYPKDHFDLIYVVQHKELVDNSPYSENCPGLDS